MYHRELHSVACDRLCGSESHSVKSDSLEPHGLHSPWNSPGQTTGVGSLSLLQYNGTEYEKSYLSITESLCWTAEINTALYTNDAS